MKTVRENMGQIALQFLCVNKEDKTYQYAHDLKLYKMKQTWLAHLKDIKSEYITILTRTLPSTSKSKSSYDIVGVLFNHVDYNELDAVNQAYWSKLKVADSDESKAKITAEFAVTVAEKMVDFDRINDVNLETYKRLPQPKKSKEPKTIVF